MSKNNHNLAQLPLFDPIVIKLTQGYETIIDPVDADLAQYKWCCVVHGDRPYAQRMAHDIWIVLHRVVLERIIQRDLQQGEVVDHIDNNPLNNLRNNLRMATTSQNIQNSRRSKNNSSGYKGVGFHRITGKWRAYITAQKREIHLGLFDTKEHALAARLEAEKEYHGQFARRE